MPAANIDKATKEANQLRRKWTAGVRPASHLSDLASRNGVLVFLLQLDNRLSGVFIRRTRQPEGIIVVNTTGKNLVHQRFTLAHELGHWLLHTDEDMIVDVIDRNDRDPRETEANVFAAQFLVPKEELRKELQSYEVRADVVTDRLVVELAQAFGVSHVVIMWRLKEVGGLRQKDVEARINKTDWPLVWQQHAPIAYEKIIRQNEPVSWDSKGVSPATAQQLSRLPKRYREMAFEAFQRRLITAGKLADILGLPSKELVLNELAPLIDLDQREADLELENALRSLSEKVDD